MTLGLPSIVLLAAIVAGALGFGVWQWRARLRILARRRHAEVHLRALFEGSIQGIIIHREGIPVAANQRAAEIFGYEDADDIRNMRSLDRGISPADLKRMLAYQRARREGKPVPEIYQFQGIRKDGSAFWAFTRVSRIQWMGSPATLATVFDISDLHKVEEELRNHQHLLQTVFDTIPYALYVKGKDRRYMMANHAMAERWSMPAKDIVGLTNPRPDLLMEHDDQVIADLDAEVFATGKVVDQVVSRAYVDGKRSRVRQIKAPLRGENGEIVGIVGLGEDVTARVEAEEQLQAQQRLMSLMINTLPHAVYVKDVENRFVEVNDANLRLHNLRREELIGKRLEDLPTAHQYDLTHLAAMDREVAATLKPVESGNQDFTMWDGTRRTHRVTKIPLLGAAGQLTGIMGIAEDVTERLAQDRALRESEQRFKDFTQGASDWFWEMDAGLRYTAVVGPTYDSRIQDPSTILGKAAWEVEYPPEEREHREKLRADLEAHQPVRGRVLRVYSRDGVRTIRYNGLPIHDALGTFLGYRGTGSDITHEVEAQQRADLAHNRLSDAVAALPAGFMLWDAQERLVMWNDRLKEILPTGKERMAVGMTYSEFVTQAVDGIAKEHAPDRAAWIEARLQAFRNPGAIQEFKLHDGRWVRMLDRRTEQGTVSLRFDVTDAKQREVELRQAQKMEALGQLTGGVAHDFNNLMQVILGYVTLAMRSLDANDPKRELLGQIRNAGQRASELTAQLLAFSRKQVLRPAAVDLNAIVSAQTKMLSRLLGARVHLETRLDPRLTNILADRGMIEQAIMNLAINARDAMPSGGKIVLATEQWQADEAMCRANPWARPGLYAALRCIDTGTGMSAEVRQRAFEPFFTTKAPGSGTGLGLSLVYGIAQQHGGTALIESELGAGTTVSVHLPADPTAPPAEEPHPLPAGTAQGQTILIAEDTDAVRDLIQHVLMENGYRVLTAHDGDVAIDLFERNADKVDLVILDVVMPNVGGLEAQERISALRPEVPILFSTGWYDQRDQKAIEDRGIGVIMKPYSSDDLLRVIRETLAQRKQAN